MIGSKFLASIGKEILILLRDPAGLVLLFVMPAFLVIVITLIQEKVTANTVDVLFVDNDKETIGLEIRKLLGQTNTIRLIEELDDNTLSASLAHNLVAVGKYQFAIILEEGLSRRAGEVSMAMVTNHLLPERKITFSTDVPAILMWFDPTVHGSFRAAVSSGLAQAIHGVQTQLFIENTFAMLPEKLGSNLPEQMLSSLPQQGLTARELFPQLFEDTSLMPVSERFATEMGFIKQPTAVQQNVPAWAIFGIFFIVVPLAGSLINERESGTLSRLRVFPVSYLTIMSGKIVAYALVCVAQFTVILAMGIFVLPVLGVAAFDPGTEYLLLALQMLSVIMAACGYGVLLGTIGNTYGQVAIFGPVSIVIAAAVGGIMVPVYALPDVIRPICLASPLYWGQSGFYDLLLREGGLPEILPEVLLLFSFCLLSMVLSFIHSHNTKNTP